MAPLVTVLLVASIASEAQTEALPEMELNDCEPESGCTVAGGGCCCCKVTTFELVTVATRSLDWSRFDWADLLPRLPRKVYLNPWKKVDFVLALEPPPPPPPVDLEEACCCGSSPGPGGVPVEAESDSCAARACSMLDNEGPTTWRRRAAALGSSRVDCCWLSSCSLQAWLAAGEPDSERTLLRRLLDSFERT